MNIFSKKSATSFVLAGLIAGCIPTTSRAVWNDFSSWSNTQKALVAIGVVSGMWAACKKSVDNPEQVTGDDVKKAFQVQDIFTQDYWINLYHLINDGIIGQIGKGKAILGVPNEETGEVRFQTTKEQPSTGLIGKALTTAKLVAKKADDLVKAVALPVAAGLWYYGEKITFSVGTDGVKASVKTDE